MHDDLRLTGKSKRSVHGYLRAVRQLADHSKQTPDTIREDQVPRLFLHRKNERQIDFGKKINIHILRHSFATCLLESGVDILTISRLLGHASFATTMVYLHCRREHLGSTPSPLDLLPVRQLPGWQQQKTQPNNDRS